LRLSICLSNVFQFHPFLFFYNQQAYWFIMHFFFPFFVAFLLTTQAEPSQGRFFIMGNGVMQLKNHLNNREAKVSLLNVDGSLNEADFNTVDWIFGYPTREKGEHISPRLLFMLDYFAERLAPGTTIHIESAYRSPEYNEKIRSTGNNAARTSTHMDGIALDFWLEGVDGKKLWETIKAHNCGGIGHYGDKTVHFDAGGPDSGRLPPPAPAARSPTKTGISIFPPIMTVMPRRKKCGWHFPASAVSSSGYAPPLKSTVRAAVNRALLPWISIRPMAPAAYGLAAVRSHASSPQPCHPI
jgi:uncharacterized protein YcbK (DUF882 family)